MRQLVSGLVFFFSLMGISLGIAAEKPVRDVGIEVRVEDVTHIYPKEEIIDLELEIHFRWQTAEHPTETQYYQGKAVDDQLKVRWWPYYKILHTRGALHVHLKSLVISPDGVADYVETLNAQVETGMDMSRFPFDSHVLKIAITPFGNSPYQQHYYLLSNQVAIQAEPYLTEWQLGGARSQLSVENQMPVYQLSFDYQRKTGFYFYKVLMPLLIIIGISHAVLWMPRETAINRLALVMTSMLTVVAFQWAVIQDIPPVSYVTLFQALLFFAYFLIGSKAILIVLGEKWHGKYRLQIMYWARWVYLLMIITGFLIIRYVFF